MDTLGTQLTKMGASHRIEYAFGGMIRTLSGFVYWCVPPWAYPAQVSWLISERPRSLIG